MRGHGGVNIGANKPLISGKAPRSWGIMRGRLAARCQLPRIAPRPHTHRTVRHIPPPTRKTRMEALATKVIGSERLTIARIITPNDLEKMTNWMHSWWGEREGYLRDEVRCFLQNSLHKRGLPRTRLRPLYALDRERCRTRRRCQRALPLHHAFRLVRIPRMGFRRGDRHFPRAPHSAAV